MDSTTLLLYAELADLMQIEMSKTSAQTLHSSQRNYQNSSICFAINLEILSEADAESIFEGMSE